MADLILEKFDHFSVAYDIVSLLCEKTVSEPELASVLQLSHSIVDKMISLMISEGFLKSGNSHGELRLTSQGFSFLQEFAGIRKFVG
ncbi:MAG: winged helix-turn-helix domain-containing protein [Nitrososphaera sp.]